MSNIVHRSWEEFLDPGTLRPRLITAAIYIAMFEATQDRLVDRVESFFTQGFDKQGPIRSPEYQSVVLSRNRSPKHACLDWLREQGAIADGDIAAFNAARAARNDVAHSLFKMVGSSGLPPDLHTHLAAIITLLHKTEVWWVKNVEIATDPDYDGREVNDDDIQPGMTLMAKMLLDIALGSDAEASFYINEFRKQFQSAGEAANSPKSVAPPSP